MVQKVKTLKKLYDFKMENFKKINKKGKQHHKG